MSTGYSRARCKGICSRPSVRLKDCNSILRDQVCRRLSCPSRDVLNSCRQPNTRYMNKLTYKPLQNIEDWATRFSQNSGNAYIKMHVRRTKSQAINVDIVFRQVVWMQGQVSHGCQQSHTERIMFLKRSSARCCFFCQGLFITEG